MTYDWAMLEALEEVDAIGWAAPPVAPPRCDPANTGLAVMMANAWQVERSMAEMGRSVLYANGATQADAALRAKMSQMGQASIDAAMRLRGR